LFAVLQPQERVAVLAHEFGHLANGDPRRGALVGSALETLLAWHNVLAPADPDEGVPDEGILSLLTLPVNMIMTLLAQLPLGLALFLATLIARESQRGEYLADAMSARIAGKDAASSFFDKVRMEPIYIHAISATSSSRWVNGSLWDEMQSKSATYPESELRRARLRDVQLATRLDRSHPPTAYRVEAIEARPTGFAQYVLAQARSEAIDQELKAVLPGMQAAIIDQHLDSLYAG
jgi:Zn-dependent protease with chaperone function